MKEFHQMREEFHPHETHVARYLVYSLVNCIMKLCIETGLRHVFGCRCYTQRLGNTHVKNTAMNLFA